MMTIVRKSATIAALLIAVAATTLAQVVPTRTQIYFDINVPYAMEMGGYNLPPGHYVLWQDSQNPNLFRLYQHDLAREPLAVIYTVRGRYWTARRGGTRIALDVDESSSEGRPVVRAFKVPFDDPWEVVSVKVKHNSLMTRVK
jgi:hypothetical protein